MPRHSIITWDNHFRNFFHLLPSIAACDYDLTEVEILLVEQGTRDQALAYAHAEDHEPAEEVASSLPAGLERQVVYLADDDVYHPGRLLTAGIERCTGEIISTMDGDVLVPPDFLTLLDAVHDRGERVVNMARSEALYPCGTTTADWKNQIIDYDLVLATTKTGHRPIPAQVPNKAPLISARRHAWEAIGGYDPHVIFATAYTLFGTDVSRRFRLALGDDVEVPLPRRSVHPWHPTGMARRDGAGKLLLDTQRRLIRWSIENNEAHVARRRIVADALYAAQRDAIDAAIADVRHT